jgi:hypothetical protein
MQIPYPFHLSLRKYFVCGARLRAIIAAICCLSIFSGDLLAMRSEQNIDSGALFHLFPPKRPSGYLSLSIPAKVSVTAVVALDAARGESLWYSAFLKRAEELNSEAAAPDGGAVLTSGTRAESDGAAETEPGNTMRRPDRVMRAAEVPLVSDFRFPRPQRDTRLFDEVFLYFPIAHNMDAIGAFDGDQMRGAVFAPPSEVGLRSRAIMREVGK